MEKFLKGQRAGAIVRLLCANPNQIVSLTELAERLKVAKSTLSEDVAALREAFVALDLGVIETVSGASGGIKWLPGGGKTWRRDLVDDLCRQLQDPHRILPGGYLYTSDLCTNARLVEEYGQLFAQVFASRRPNVVLTVEMKGIPLAYATARNLGVPLAICRKELPAASDAGWTSLMRHERTEGPTVNINYASGSQRRVQTMSLPRRSVPTGAKALIIDDFMRAGGTAHGLEEMMTEIGGTTVGCGVLIATREPEVKLIKNYVALAVLDEVDEQTQQIKARPGNFITE